jgi:hypothetical protein
VVVVGGGSIVDALRAIDREQRLSPERSHWWAIRAMSLTAAIMAERIPEAELVDSLGRLPRPWSAGLWILDVEPFMRADARGAEPLPCSWETTSDAIAARVACAVGAGELVLLKSALPETASREAWSAAGYVDGCFARATGGVPVRCVNLRSDDYTEVVDTGVCRAL